MSIKAREVVFHSLIISRLLYALPAFAGSLSRADIALFNALIRKSVRWGILEHLFDFDELIAAAENRLFKRFSFNINHCLHQLLPEERNTGYILRKRGHNFLLPVVMKALFKKVMLLTIYTKTSNAKCELTIVVND